MNEDPIREQSFEQSARALRVQIKAIAKLVKAMHSHSDIATESRSEMDVSEMHSNITLAYRHLEDAGMRLGKAIQAYDGGVSVYDKRES